MLGCLRSALCLLLLCVAFPLPAGEPAASPAPTGGPKQAEFDRRFEQWKKEVLEPLRAFRVEYPNATGSRKLKIKQQYQELVERGQREEAAVVDAALAACLEAPPEEIRRPDNPLTNFLFGVLQSEIFRDQYETVLRLGKPLIERGLPEQDRDFRSLYSWVGDAAFATADWDLAETCLKKAVQFELTGKNDAIYLKQLSYYRKAWPKEQEIRAAEARADDLPRVVLKTNKGDIVLELFENEAPNTVANFISLVEKGFYDGLTFHRVLPAFVAQGGDPKGDGTGDAGYAIPCECYQPNHRFHFRGSLSMAHAGRDTGSSQFFLNIAPAANLDGRHTVFGRVIEGLDVLGKLQRRDPQDPDSAAMDPDTIVSAKVLRKRNHPYEPKTLSLSKNPRGR